MNQKRHFIRVRFKAKCSLTHNKTNYPGQLENISINGALISLNDGIVIPRDDICSLTVYLEDENTPLHLVIEVMYCKFTMIGVKFTKKNAETRKRLEDLIDRLTTEQENLVKEQRLYCREIEE